jgi:hypothetical protein
MKVTLKNGSLEEEVLVQSTMVILRSLTREKPMVFYELVMMCRNSSYRLFEHTAQDLHELDLITPEKTVPDNIRNVVLSAAVGEGLNSIILRSPIMGEEA